MKITYRNLYWLLILCLFLWTQIILWGFAATVHFFFPPAWYAAWWSLPCVLTVAYVWWLVGLIIYTHYSRYI